MKINDISLTMVSRTIAEGKYAGQPISFGGENELAVVTVHTDEGIDGHSFLGSSMCSADIFARPFLTYLKPVLMGQNPLDIGSLWHKLWHCNRYASLRSIGALDIALWDIAGKVANMSIHRLLGTCRDSVPAYASSAFLPTSQDYAEEALHYKSIGWTAYKIHPHAKPTEDIEICKAVKKAVGIITAPITATISVSALDLDIAISTIDANVTIDVTARSILLVDPFNTFILQNETRLNTVTAETRSFILQNDSRSFNVKPETRIYNLLKETRNFKIKRPAFVGRVRKDTVNV